ncbi:MAG: hypothetical protein ACI9TY_000758 [Alphaproteobacteria bacterium]|jgi:hypothetical protein
MINPINVDLLKDSQSNDGISISKDFFLDTAQRVKKLAEPIDGFAIIKEFNQDTDADEDKLFMAFLLLMSHDMDILGEHALNIDGDGGDMTRASNYDDIVESIASELP